MVFSIIIDGFQNLIGTVRQWNGPVALLGLRWTLENAANQIAIQIQSSVTSISKAQVGSDVNAEGKESVTSSYERTSQVSATLRNRQDVRVLETVAREGVVGVVACMSKSDAAKPYREDYQSARDALVSSMAVLEMTNHPLEKFANYDKQLEC